MTKRTPCHGIETENSQFTVAVIQASFHKLLSNTAPNPFLADIHSDNFNWAISFYTARRGSLFYPYFADLSNTSDSDISPKEMDDRYLRLNEFLKKIRPERTDKD